MFGSKLPKSEAVIRSKVFLVYLKMSLKRVGFGDLLWDSYPTIMLFFSIIILFIIYDSRQCRKTGITRKTMGGILSYLNDTTVILVSLIISIGFSEVFLK